MLSPLRRPAGQVFPAEPSAQVSFQKRGQLVDGELSILTIDLENNLVTLLSSKSEDGEDRLCVGRLLVFGQGDLALKSLGVLYEDGGRPGVQARLASKCDRSFQHESILSIPCHTSRTKRTSRPARTVPLARRTIVPAPLETTGLSITLPLRSTVARSKRTMGVPA